MTKRTYKISRHIPSIFQSKLDFSPARQGFSLSMEHPAERTLMRVLCATLVVLACAYLYFVTASVLNVMGRKDALTQISHIDDTIGNLEGQYFALSQAVTPQAGEAIGLVPVTQTQYVYRPGTIGAATIGGTNEI